MSFDTGFIMILWKEGMGGKSIWPKNIILKKQESKLPTDAIYNVSSLLKYIICTMCYLIFTHYVISIIVNIYIFVNFFKYQVSQTEEQNIIHNMPFTVCTSQYALHSRTVEQIGLNIV